MIKVHDLASEDYIKDKMQDVCNLADGDTIDDDFQAYLETEHQTWFTKDFTSFICVQYCNNYIAIPYTYSDGTHKSTRELFLFAKRLYKRYTIKEKKPIIYTGLTNKFPKHSKQLGDNLWQFIPKGM